MRAFGTTWACVAAAAALVACGGDGNDDGPAIEFAASQGSIAPGEVVTLSWQVTGATVESVSGLSTTPGTSAVVAPAQTTTYVLSATNDAGRTFTKSVTVNVATGTPVASVAVDTAQPGTEIPRDFLGFSHPWGQAQMMMGDPSIGVNAIYRQLLSNLIDVGGKPLPIRIGGTVTDATTAPNEGTVRPFAKFYSDLRTGGRDTSFILGVNLGRNDPKLAAAQTHQYVETMPAGSISSIQLGNEPDLFGYQRFRPMTYTFDQYLGELQLFTDTILAQTPTSPLFTAPSDALYPQGAGPYPFLTEEGLNQLLRQSGPVIENVGQHSYIRPGSGCGGAPQSGVLLEPESSTREATWASPYIAITKAAGKKYRLDEMNSISCEGEDGITNAFEQALWTPDALFEYAKAGASGVNLITKNWNRLGKFDPYGAFVFNIPESQYKNLPAIASTTWLPPANIEWSADYSLKSVQALYYGMMLFAETTADQARLIPATLTGDGSNIKSWATLDVRAGRVNVLLINKNTKAGAINIAVPGYSRGVVKRLRAPSFSARSGFTLAGQTFDGSVDGKPLGVKYGETVSSGDGNFKVSVEPTTAVLITLTK